MGKPAKLLHIMSACTVGGCEMHVLTILEGLTRTGEYDIHLAYFTERPDAARSLKEDFERVGVQTHDLRAKAKWDPLAIVRLASLMRQQRFDIVHSHGYRSDTAASLLGGALRLAPVVVSSVHNEEPIYLSRPFAQLTRFASRWQDRIISISDAVRGYLIRQTGIPPDKIVRVHYGLAEDSARRGAQGGSKLRHELGLPSNAKVVTVIGRLAQQKGHRYLIEAFPDILVKVPSAALLLVGHEDSLTQAELKRMVKGHGVDDRVVFGGYRDDVAGILRQSDVMALPSLWEGFGLVLLEAMEAGCPIVATSVGPIPEVVVDGETGLLVPPADPEALADAITALLSDRRRASQMAEAGRRRLETHFTARRMVAETHAIYQELLGERRSREEVAA